MRKTIVEWVSRILWLMGALFALTACVCLMIAFAKTEVSKGNVARYFPYPSTQMSRVTGYVILAFPETLYKAVGYDAMCAFLCFLVAKVLHWFSSKGE